MDEEVRAPDKVKIKADYLKGIKPSELSTKYDVSINTLKSWIKRYGWSDTKKKQGAPSHKKGAPLNNRNAVGNKGGAAPEKNKNSEKYGFFAKYLPEETLEIFNAIENSNPLDLLWHQIQFAYTAIVRAQKLMYVKDQEDVTTTKIGEGFSESGSSEKWEVQQAWDKHASFMQAQARQQSSLNGLIRQYEELCKSDLATEEQKERVRLIKAQADKLAGTDNLEELSKLDQVLAQIKGVV